MNEQEQRIAIAMACGFKINRKSGSQLDYDGFPDYLHDLNAMREAVENLTKIQRRDYVNALWVVVNPDIDWDSGSSSVNFFNYINATAAQRAQIAKETRKAFSRHQREKDIARTAGKQLNLTRGT